MPARPFLVAQLDRVAPCDRFRRWVAIYGVSRLSRSLATDRRTIHTWTQRLRPTLPHIEKVRNIIALSTIEPLIDGPLTYEDFFGKVKIVAHTSQQYGRTVVTRRVI